MKTDIITGLAIEIKGELGKPQTLPIEYLISIAKTLQELVFAIADTDITEGNKVNRDDFKIELSGFIKSSAIPVFVLTPRTKQLTLHKDLQKQRGKVSNGIDKLLEIANNNDFPKLKDYYPDANRRNKVIETLYNFTQSFNNSPTSFGKLNSNNKFIHSYKLHKLGIETKQNLLTEIKGNDTIEEAEEYSEFREVLINKNKSGKKPTSKLISSIKSYNHSLSYSPGFILVNSRKYTFISPPISPIKKEEDHFVIKNELLDIYAGGKSEDEAEKDFNEEFDYLYQRLNSLEDKNLSDRFIEIKKFINYFVKAVEAW